MFDTYNSPTRRVTENVYVTEKRAATDESVRLLKEMEQAARDSVIKSVQLENNVISAVVHTAYDHLSCKHLYAVLMKINGKNHRIDVDVNEWDATDSEKLIFAVAEAIAKQLTAIILPDVAKTHLNQGFTR